MASFTKPLIVGVIITKGKNEVVETYSNYNYQSQSTTGEKFIPEGHFCRFDTDGTDNMLLADSTNGYCISLSASPIDTNIPNWGNQTQVTSFAKQDFCLRCTNITVAFEDTDIGNGSIGDPVYVSDNGKATLVGVAGQNNIGILKSAIFSDSLNSRGQKQGAIAYIDFYGKQQTVGA